MSDSYNRRSRKRAARKKAGGCLVPALFLAAAFLAVLVLAWQTVGAGIAARYLPSTEHKDLNEWFEVEGDEIRIYLDGQMVQDQTGLRRGGAVYLPLDYVAEAIEDRFFRNTDDTVSVTMPEQAFHFDADSTWNDTPDQPVLIKDNDRLYIRLDTVESFTHMTDDAFIGAEETAARVFLYSDEGPPADNAETAKKTAVRTRTTVTSPILEDLAKGDRVTVLDETGDWSRVQTAHGIIGYIQSSLLASSGESAAESSHAASDPLLSDDLPFAMHTAEHIADHISAHAGEHAADYQLMSDYPVMAWHMVWGTPANASFESLYANTGGAINVISPTWLQISDADGNYENYSDAAYMEKAHAAGLQVWACVDNFNQPGGVSEFHTGRFFSDREKRSDFIRRLMSDAETFGYDGINLDFEGIAAESGPAYLQFIRDLSLACHARGLTLSVDNYMPYDFNAFYDLGEQALYADYVILMGYDEHTGSDVGSVASIGWVRQGLERALAVVPAEHLIGAVPLYTRRWVLAGDAADQAEHKARSVHMTMLEALDYIREEELPLTFDESSGQYYGEKKTAEGQVRLWMEETESLRLKSDLMQSMHLGGIAAWCLGYEPAEVWEILNWNAGE